MSIKQFIGIVSCFLKQLFTAYISDMLRLRVGGAKKGAGKE